MVLESSSSDGNGKSTKSKTTYQAQIIEMEEEAESHLQSHARTVYFDVYEN